MRTILKKAQPIRHAVEIGTFQGVTSLLIGEYSSLVTTFDISDLCVVELPPHVHKWTVPQDRKLAMLAGLDFDFAYIDGDHNYAGVLADWEAVKKCGRVLFHDAAGPWKEGTMKVIENHVCKLKGHITYAGLFAYWEAA